MLLATKPYQLIVGDGITLSEDDATELADQLYREFHKPTFTGEALVSEIADLNIVGHVQHAEGETYVALVTRDVYRKSKPENLLVPKVTHCPTKRTHTGTYRDYVDRDILDVLTFLGQQEVFDMATTSELGVMMSNNDKMQQALEAAKRYGRDFQRRAEQLVLSMNVASKRYRETGEQKWILESVQPFIFPSHILGTGCKTVELNSEWCEQLDNTRVDAPCSQYHQPFDAMVVNFPADYATSRIVEAEFLDIDHAECFSTKTTMMALVWWPNARVLMVEECLAHQKRTPLIRWIVPIPNDDRPLSEALFCPDPQSESALRIALNTMLVMTHAKPPTTRKMQMRKGHKHRVRSLRKSKRDEEADLEELKQASMPTILAFSQDITLRFDDSRSSDDSEPTGRRNKPHWRRGFWRKQPFGKGLTNRKMIWIQPVLVNAKLFQGSLNNTETTYRA